MRSRGNLVRKTIAPRGHHIFAIFPPAFLCYLYLDLHKLSPWRFPMGLGCSRGIPSISEPSLHLLPMGGMQTAPPAAAVPESPQNHSSSQKSKSLLPNIPGILPMFQVFLQPPLPSTRIILPPVQPSAPSAAQSATSSPKLPISGGACAGK